MRRLSTRLMLRLAIAATVSWALSSAVSGLILRHELDEAFDSGLRNAAERLMPIIEQEMSHATPPRDIGGSDRHGDTFVAYQLRDAGGHVLLSSADAPSTAYAAPLARGFSTANGMRIFTVRSEDGSAYLHVAEPLRHRREAAFESTLGLIQPLLVLLPAMLIGVWWAVRHGLAPLRELSQRIGQRGSGDLTPIPDLALPADLRPIADATNRLLGRLRATLSAERAFSTSAAHELRTPIAGALAEVQRLGAEVEGAPAARRVALVELSLKRIGRLSEKLLQLSRADALVTPAHAHRDLLPALGLVMEEFREAPFVLTPAAPADFPGRMDLDSFAIATRNLIENAVRHGRPGTPIVVELTSNALTVSNECDVVPAAILEDTTSRFRRSVSANPGSGLGLTIAHTIAARAGGRLELASPAPGRPDGFSARLLLPT